MHQDPSERLCGPRQVQDIEGVQMTKYLSDGAISSSETTHRIICSPRTGYQEEDLVIRLISVWRAAGVWELPTLGREICHSIMLVCDIRFQL